jgi:hypothetical protein
MRATRSKPTDAGNAGIVEKDGNEIVVLSRREID